MSINITVTTCKISEGIPRFKSIRKIGSIHRSEVRDKTTISVHKPSSCLSRTLKLDTCNVTVIRANNLKQPTSKDGT